MRKSTNKAQKVSSRRDGRKAMLIYMKPEIIEAVKEAALAGDLKAWQFVERALERVLKTHERSRSAR